MKKRTKKWNKKYNKKVFFILRQYTFFLKTKKGLFIKFKLKDKK